MKLLILLIFITNIFCHLDELDLPDNCEYIEINNNAFIANCKTNDNNDNFVQTPHYEYDKECSWINCNGFLLCDRECEDNLQGEYYYNPNGFVYYDFTTQDFYSVKGETCNQCYFYQINGNINFACECDFGEYYTFLISTTQLKFDVEYYNCNGFLYYIEDSANQTLCPNSTFTSEYEHFAQSYEESKFITVPGNYDITCHYCYMFNINGDYSLLCSCGDMQQDTLLLTSVHINDCNYIENINGMLTCTDYMSSYMSSYIGSHRTVPGWSIAIMVIFGVLFLIASIILIIFAIKYYKQKHSDTTIEIELQDMKHSDREETSIVSENELNSNETSVVSVNELNNSEVPTVCNEVEE